jgi:hypothetical protein
LPAWAAMDMASTAAPTDHFIIFLLIVFLRSDVIAAVQRLL